MAKCKVIALGKDKFLLHDGSGRVTLLMWLNVYDDCWDVPDLKVGASVRAHGTVGQFKEERQVEAGYGGDVKVLSPRTAPPLHQIGTITTKDLTTLATIEGAVNQAEAFSQGQRVCAEQRVTAYSRQVRVDSIVEEYGGTLELVPRVPIVWLCSPLRKGDRVARGGEMGCGWPPRPENVEEAESICRELGLVDLLKRMPAGLYQMVRETGWQLSHGERSRLYIARALLQGANLILLNESFAALDPENLLRALRCILERAPTLLVIAHP